MEVYLPEATSSYRSGFTALLSLQSHLAVQDIGVGASLRGHG
jgi:hypothetical protein